MPFRPASCLSTWNQRPFLVWAQTPLHQCFYHFTFSPAERRVSVGAEHETQARVKLAVGTSSIRDSHSATSGNQELRRTDTGAFMAYLSLCSRVTGAFKLSFSVPCLFLPTRMWSIWSYPLHTLSPCYHLTNPHSFTHSLYTGNVNLGLQPQSLFWAQKYHSPRRPTAGWSLHTDVPTAPQVTLPWTVPPPKFPDPMERAATHAPGTLSGNPGLCPLLFFTASNRQSSCHTHFLSESLCLSTANTPFWPLPSLTQDTALSSTIFSRKHNQNASSLCLRAFSCLSLTLEIVQTPHPAVWDHEDWTSGRLFSITSLQSPRPDRPLTGPHSPTSPLSVLTKRTLLWPLSLHLVPSFPLLPATLHLSFSPQLPPFPCLSLQAG